MTMLQRIEAQGVTLYLGEEGRIRYRAPAGVMTPERREWLRSNKDRLRAELEARKRTPEDRPALRVYRFSVRGYPGEFTLIAPGTSLAEAEAGLRLRFGDRLRFVRLHLGCGAETPELQDRSR